MIESDRACPKCSGHQFWRVMWTLSRTQKMLYSVLHCDLCDFTTKEGWLIVEPAQEEKPKT